MQAISIDTDRDSYCRYRSDLGMDVVTAHLAFTGAQAGDVVTANLVRMDGFGPVPGLQQTVTCSAGQASATVTFALADGIEAQGAYPGSGRESIFRAVAGPYQVQATATGMSGSAASSTIYVDIVPIDELRGQWLQGVVLQARDVLMPFQQPSNCTGVTITRVSEGTNVGVHTLQFNPGTPGTLSYDGGTAVNVPAKRGSVALVSPSNDYVICSVVPFLLPATAASDSLVIEEAAFTDDALRNYVQRAQRSLESFFYFPLEPRMFDTDPVANAKRNQPFIEQAVQPVTYHRPSDFDHWMSLTLQHRRILRVYHLDGWFNNSAATSITGDWIVFNEIAATLELVPNNGAVIAWQFYGAAVLQFFLNFETIPSFWHFGYTAGLPSLDGEYQVFREAVAKQAAVDILAQAGYAMVGGAGSISTGRDGVSDSRSYGARPGDALITQHQKWLDQNLPRLRQRYGGLLVGVI